MSIVKNGLIYLAAVCVLNVGAFGLTRNSVAAVPEKASSQLDEIGSASLVAAPSGAPAPQ
jgi:hypothetical protein